MAGPELIELVAGDYRAVVSPVGAALASLSVGTRPLVLDTTAALAAGAVPMPPFSGAVLAPWPNRIRDGRYSFAGHDHQLAITEVGRRCALHGLLAWTVWDVAESAGDGARLTATVRPQPGYPFTVAVDVDYRVGPDGLSVDIAARNDGASAAPFGASVHPYLVPGVAGGDMGEWSFSTAAETVLDVEADRLLPRDLVPVDALDLDFRTPRRLDGLLVDHAFAVGGAEPLATLVGPDGFAVRMGWDERCPWVQVCTIDEAPEPWRRTGLAVEPMTCPPDAFNSGTDLWILQPGERRDLGLTIFAAV